MNNRVSEAIEHLNKILPLKAAQSGLTDELIQLHRALLYSYIDIGRSLSRAEIAQKVDDADKAIAELKQSQLIVVDDAGELTGAYPFTMEARVHEIHVQGYLVHCMCALDSLAVSAMYDLELEIHSQCDLSGTPIIIRQKGMRLLNPAELEDVYFAINWQAASATTCCANSLCTEMIFIKGKELAENWRQDDAEHRQVFTLDEAVEFAAGFFKPLLD